MAQALETVQHTFIALTIKAYDYQEADRLLHVFSPDSGPKTILVKGARKATSKLAGACDPLMINRLEVFEGRHFDRLKRYETVAAFPQFRLDLPRLAMAHVVCDWLRCLSSGEGDPHAQGAFETAVAALCSLHDHSMAQPMANPADKHPDALVVSLQRLLIGQIALLEQAGYLPDLFTMVDTGQPYEDVRLLDRHHSPLFSVDWGGLVSDGAGARAQGHTVLQLKPHTLLSLQRLVRCRHQPDAVDTLPSVDLYTLVRLERFLRFYVEHRLRQPLKSHSFLLDCLGMPLNKTP
jgi:recombinational DNA repair protein (RecF pathway)